MNINGHKHKGFDKYSDQRFINEIKEKDIICLMETHCSLENSLIEYHLEVFLSMRSTQGGYK
jgi:hypothetical protein